MVTIDTIGDARRPNQSDVDRTDDTRRVVGGWGRGSLPDEGDGELRNERATQWLEGDSP